MKDLSHNLGSVDSSEESVTGASTNILKLRQNEEISMIGDGYVASAVVCLMVICLMVKTNQKPRGSKKWFLVIYDCYYGTVVCLSLLSWDSHCTHVGKQDGIPQVSKTPFIFLHF